MGALSDVMSRALRQGKALKLLPRACRLVPAPKNLQEKDVFLFRNAEYQEHGVAWLHTFSNSVVYAHPLVDVEGRVRVKPGQYNFSVEASGPWEIRRALGSHFGKPFYKGVHVLFFDQYSASSVFHWLCDSLPRLLSVETLLGDDAVVLLPHARGELAKLQELTLNAMGSCHSVRRVSLERPIRVEHLLVPDFSSHPGRHRPEQMHQVRSRMRAFFTAEKQSECDVVYISRRFAGSRRTINEDEVQASLAKFNVRTVYLERLTASAQIESICNAKCIIGNHGGGLPAMLYAREDCMIVEIRSRTDTHNNCYYSLAGALGLPYYYLLATPVDITRGNDSDWLVDCNALETLLGQLL